MNFASISMLDNKGYPLPDFPPSQRLNVASLLLLYQFLWEMFRWTTFLGSTCTDFHCEDLPVHGHEINLSLFPSNSIGKEEFPLGHFFSLQNCCYMEQTPKEMLSWLLQTSSLFKLRLILSYISSIICNYCSFFICPYIITSPFTNALPWLALRFCIEWTILKKIYLSKADSIS